MMKPPYKKKSNSYDFFSHNGLQKNKRPTQDASFQNLIEVAANHLGMGDQLHAIRICNDARKLLHSYFPNASANGTQPDLPEQSSISVVSFKNNTLSLTAGNSSLIHQLTMKKHLLQTELNAKFGLNTVKKINIRARS